MTNETAYFQFLLVNDYLLQKNSISEPFERNDENLEKKLTEEIKEMDDQTNTMLDMVEFKLKYNIHSETMQMYLTGFQWGDYKWQVLSRLLLLYQTFKNSMDLETINKMSVIFDDLKNK